MRADIPRIDGIDEPLAEPSAEGGKRSNRWLFLALAMAAPAVLGVAGWAGDRSFPDVWNAQGSSAVVSLERRSRLRAPLVARRGSPTWAWAQFPGQAGWPNGSSLSRSKGPNKRAFRR